MAENKKSFVLYADQYDLFKKLPDEVAGKLIKHIFSYVNDENPTTDDLLIEVAFDPIKRQMKRDFEKWENIKIIRSKNGKKGGRPTKQMSEDEEKKLNKAKKANGFSEKLNKAKKAVTDTVTVTVTDTVINNKESGDKSPTHSQYSNLKITLSERKEKFKKSLTPFLEIYGKDMLNKFYSYWTEMNKSKTKMLFELKPTFEISKRLATWANRENIFYQKDEKNKLTVKV